MQNYKHGNHTVWDCKYHLVWTATKYRYEMLAGDVGIRCKELLREIARSKRDVDLCWSVNRDHIHMLIEIHPNLALSRAVQCLKERVRANCCWCIVICVNDIEISIFVGKRVLGSYQVMTLRMRFGRDTSRISSSCWIRDLGCSAIFCKTGSFASPSYDELPLSK